MHIWKGILLTLLMVQPSMAQRRLVSTIDFDEALAYYRPRISVAVDGSYAIAWEALRKLDQSEAWGLAVQQFSPEGEALGSLHYLDPQSLCVSSGGWKDVQNASLAFTNDGNLAVAANLFSSVPQGGEPIAALAWFDRKGERLFEDGRVPCPETPAGEIEVAREGEARFVLAGAGAFPLIGYTSHAFAFPAGVSIPQTKLISFAREFSGSIAHAGDFDMASNGTMAVAAWHECPPVADNEADECDIMARFYDRTPSQPFKPIGPRLRVNQGDAPGTLNYRPSVAMNDQGESMVVWIDYREGEQGDVFGQRFDASGMPAGGNVAISSGQGAISDLEAIRPEVALLDSGEAMVVWTDLGRSGMRAWGRLYDAEGRALGSPYLLDDVQSAETGFPDVASNGHSFEYVWMAKNDGVPTIYTSMPSGEGDGYDDLPGAAPTLSLKGYPNPFSEAATLEYSLKETGRVTLVIYDLLGREVKKLVDQHQGPGSYYVTVKGEELAMGYYITKLQQGDERRAHLLIRAQ